MSHSSVSRYFVLYNDLFNFISPQWQTLSLRLSQYGQAESFNAGKLFIYNVVGRRLLIRRQILTWRLGQYGQEKIIICYSAGRRILIGHQIVSLGVRQYVRGKIFIIIQKNILWIETSWSGSRLWFYDWDNIGKQIHLWGKFIICDSVSRSILIGGRL